MRLRSFYRNSVFFFFIINCVLYGNNIYAEDKSEQLVSFPLQWEFLLPSSGIILTSDQQLNDLHDPDKKINMSFSSDTVYRSLREICEGAKRSGATRMSLAFDNFWRQYRKDAGDERNLLPDSDEYISKVKKIGKFIESYGMGLELSLLSPLELGPVFQGFGGELGRWVHYTTGLRDSLTGQFDVALWEQLAWSNNKGKFTITRTGVRAFAYKEKVIAGGSMSVVKPEDIIEITSGINVEEWPGTESSRESDFRSRRLRISHNGDGTLKGYDRVFVLVSYQTPEMDYFSPKALPFLTNIVEKYHKAGIRIDAFYSDEMHIQQDWRYFSHHDNGQFCLRYLTKNMAQEYAKRYGAQFEDMDKYMIYFVYGPKMYLNTAMAIKNNQIVMGESQEDIHTTFLFRDRYYKLLTNQVVDIFLTAKRRAEKLYGRTMLSRAHATWAESPTIDLWDVERLHHPCCQYEYTPNFIWSNTVQQAASACYDYFRWGDYLTGNGNDTAECGWLDNNYYGCALACSFGILNKYPNAYAAFWGMPHASAQRKMMVVNAFGASATPTIQAITDDVHRDVDVLMLYPMNLVAVEERFGSWMVQYAYGNYITAEKLLEMGKVTDSGTIEIAGRSFSTLVALFEVLPQPGLLEMIEQFSQAGGKVIWTGPPPIISADGNACLDQWENIFGVNFQSDSVEGIYSTGDLFSLPPRVKGCQGYMAAGENVIFENILASVPTQTILTDFIVDRIYPVKPSSQSEIVAKVSGKTVGSLRKNGEGITCFLGFRPRDDQSASLGQEQRTLFEILNALNAYPSTGKFSNINDNTEYLSRTTDYLTTRFPNGTTIIAPHYRTQRELWPAGFARDDTLDARLLKDNPLPSDEIHLNNFKVNGHEVTFDGRSIVAFRVDSRNQLTAFEGHECDRITVDGTTYLFSNQKQSQLSWAPVAKERLIKNKAFLQIFLVGSGEVSIPLMTPRRHLQLFAEGAVIGTKGESVPFKYNQGILRIIADNTTTGRWLYLIGEE